MGRATVRTAENAATIIAALEKGASITIAAECAGIDPSTLYEWKRESPEFRDSIARAKAQRAQRCLEKIVECDDWRAQAWYLERQYPEDFALVQRIEQVLKQYGVIAPGIKAQIDDVEMAERLGNMSTESVLRALTNEQLLNLWDHIKDNRQAEDDGTSEGNQEGA